MKSVMISINPEWCVKIANGRKTLELRKTKPKIEPPFKCYVYCTNTRPYLVWGDVFRGSWETEFTSISGYNREQAEKIWDVFNGHVVGEFVCDYILSHCEMANADIAEMQSCVRREDILEYANGKEVYGWHISKLVIYDKPKELSEFFVYCDRCDKRPISCKFAYEENNENGYYSECMCDFKRPIERPPQSWCYVEDLA